MNQRLELYIKTRAQELYLEWCNNPDSSVAATIAKGMQEAITQVNTPVIELKPSGDYLVDTNRFAKVGEGGVLEYLPNELTIFGELAENIRWLASSFVMSEEVLLNHLVNLGKLAASTEMYIQDKEGNYIPLGSIN